MCQYHDSLPQGAENPPVAEYRTLIASMRTFSLAAVRVHVHDGIARIASTNKLSSILHTEKDCVGKRFLFFGYFKPSVEIVKSRQVFLRVLARFS